MQDTNTIVDLSHTNRNPNFVAAAADGIVAVIHKATQGTGFIDPTYRMNWEQARRAGLLWGAYHVGTECDGAEQAEVFLRTIQPDPSVLLVLNLQANGQGRSMTLRQARSFVGHIQHVTGRWPGLYADAYLKELLGVNHDSVLANCWLWLSQYAPTPTVPPNWGSWTIWQYTDGAAGLEPHGVAGVGRCGRDKFSGTPDELKRFWMPPVMSARAPVVLGSSLAA